MNDITGLLNNVKGEYKNVLTAANSDYLSMISQSINIGDTLEINFSSSDFNRTSYLFNSSAPASFRIYLLNGVINLINGCTITTLTANGVDINTGIGTDMKLYEGQDINIVVEATINTDLIVIGGRGNGTFQTNMEVVDFTVKTELFKPSGNGLTYEGSEGTVVTRNTLSSGGLNYINLDMIQKVYGSDLNYKDVLTAANSDYLSFPSFDFEGGDSMSFDFDNYDLTNSVYAIGSRTFGNCYIIVSSSTVQIRSTSGAFVTYNHTESFLNTLEVNFLGTDIEVIINGNNLGVQDVTGLSYNFNQINERAALGFYEDLTVLDFTLNGETFKPSGNGLTYLGSEGTVVTRNTLSSGGINYVNIDMIQKI